MASVLEVAEGQFWRLGESARLDARALSGRLVRVRTVMLCRDMAQSVAYVDAGSRKAVTVRVADLDTCVQRGRAEQSAFPW